LSAYADGTLPNQPSVNAAYANHDMCSLTTADCNQFTRRTRKHSTGWRPSHRSDD